jgi:hypothetical protein
LSKDALLQVLATDGPLDSETVRNGWKLLWSRECDFEARSKLLTRYLAQPLSDSETAWAYIHPANSLAAIFQKFVRVPITWIASGHIARTR